jgi:hypothetical protein
MRKVAPARLFRIGCQREQSSDTVIERLSTTSMKRSRPRPPLI